MSEKTNTGVSLDAQILRAGQLRAREESRSFSGHVEFLLRRDLGQPEDEEKPKVRKPKQTNGRPGATETE